MAVTSSVERSRTTTGLRRAGIVVLVIGLAGIALWALMASFAASYGSVAADSLAGQIPAVRVEDPVNEPDVWSGRSTDHGPVVWEGTWAEYEQIVAEGRAAYQAELRGDWLHPSLAVTAIGAALLSVDLVRRRVTAA